MIACAACGQSHWLWFALLATVSIGVALVVRGRYGRAVVTPPRKPDAPTEPAQPREPEVPRSDEPPAPLRWAPRRCGNDPHVDD